MRASNRVTNLTLPSIFLLVLGLGPAPQPQISHALSQELQTARVAVAASTRSLALPAGQGDSKEAREGSINGGLLDGLGQPIPNAAINVRKVGSTGVGRSLGTDSDGQFRADGLSRGAYAVSAYVPGYVAESTNDSKYYRPGDTVTLRMIKGAVITGTVTNSTGEPVVAVRVSATRVRDAEGRPARGAFAPSRETDDRGVYRLYGLQSGTYLVAANGSSFSYSSPSAYDGDAPTYHPSTTRDAASEITVRIGDEISGIDIRYRGEGGHIVSGTVSGSIGSGTLSRGVTIALSRRSSGAMESRTYIPLRGGERGFALYGVPDGEYELQGQIDNGSENAAASLPRPVVVKGSDVTGIDVALAPLGSIAGRVMLEGFADSQRQPECNDKRAPAPDEVVVVDRLDINPKGRERFNSSLMSPPEGAPDERGEFKIYGLWAGRHRIETRLPSENWFVRSITISTAPRRQTDVAIDGFAVASGEHVSGVTVTVAAGGGAIRGKVVAGSTGITLPNSLRVHLIPAEADAADASVRFFEAAVDNDNRFSISNVAPGRYLIFARAVPDQDNQERAIRPAAWDASARISLRIDARAANTAIEIAPCQHVNEYVLKYTPDSREKR